MPVRRLSVNRKLALSVAAVLALTFGATREARADGGNDGAATQHELDARAWPWGAVTPVLAARRSG